LCDNLDNQPLGVYNWTTDINYETHEDVRNKLISNYQKTNIVSADLNSTMNKKSYNRDIRASMSSQQSHNRHKQDSEQLFSEVEDQKLEEKYMNELFHKHKYNVNEINEKLIVTNDFSRKLLFDILENTVYNIISEAVYGETDLTVKTAIYFKK
jgi:hypothetical protein